MYHHDPKSYKDDAELKLCPQCNGSGIYQGRGHVVNGVFKGYVGQCFACNGKGQQNRADAYRNQAYVKHNLARLAGM